jgi:hypothetical protein
MPLGPEPVHRGTADLRIGAVLGRDPVFAQGLGQSGQITGGPDQDGIEAWVDHAEGRGVVKPGVVPA